MRALSIRQPYAEQILRGDKTIEYRSRPTRLIGERFYIYASKNSGQLSAFSGQPVPDTLKDLPRGVIVGTATITRCERENGHYCWHLSKVKRLPRSKQRKPKRQPQPVWFRPF